MNLYMKLIEIRKMVEKANKDNKAYNFEYVSGNQLLEKIRPKMDELNVLLVTSIVPGTLKYQDVRNMEKDKYGKDKLVKDVFVTAEMIMTWINAEEPTERLEVPFVLCGQQDDISQSLGSGLTYSERYFMLKFFNVATDGDDPDKLNSDKKTANDKPQNTPQQEKPNQPTKLSDAQLGRLYAIASKKGYSPKLVNERIKASYRCEPADMTKVQYEKAVASYEAM